MTTERQKKGSLTGRANEQKSSNSHAPAGREDSCRCKETSGMTPRELLQVMIRDLAFWRKEKK